MKNETILRNELWKEKQDKKKKKRKKEKKRKRKFLVKILYLFYSKKQSFCLNNNIFSCFIIAI